MRDLIDSVQDLFEMPEIIGNEDFGLDSKKINADIATYILNDASTVKVGDIKGHTLYKCDNKYAIIENDMVVYYVKYEISHIKLLKSDAIQQVALWRDIDSEYNDVASVIFFDYLLPMTGCMVTDLYQTEYGQRFWESRVNDAFKKSLNVLYVDTTSGNIVKMKDIAHLRELKDEIWGDGEQYQHRRVVIMK
jgi:hypothetical protein